MVRVCVTRQTDRGGNEMTNEVKGLVQRAVAWGVAVLLLLAGFYGAGWLAWKGMLSIPANVARALALGSMVALPVVIWATWRLALRYAAGVVDGIGMGVKEVSKAGSDVADLRVHVHHALRERPEPAVAVLPPVRVVFPELAAKNQIVEL